MSDHTDDYEYDPGYDCDRASDHSSPSTPSQRGASLERPRRDGIGSFYSGQLSIKPNKVYIGGLPSHTTRDDLEKAFGKIGQILVIELKFGFAFIEFERVEAAEACVDQYHEGIFNGSTIRVEVCRGGARRSYGVCYTCGDPNHWAPQCPQNKRIFKGGRAHEERQYTRRESPESSTSDSEPSPYPKPRLVDRIAGAKYAYERDDAYETGPASTRNYSGDEAAPEDAYNDRATPYNHVHKHEYTSGPKYQYDRAYDAGAYNRWEEYDRADAYRDDHWYDDGDASYEHPHRPYPVTNATSTATAFPSYTPSAPRSAPAYGRPRTRSTPYARPGHAGFPPHARRLTNSASQGAEPPRGPWKNHAGYAPNAAPTQFDLRRRGRPTVPVVSAGTHTVRAAHPQRPR